MFYGLLRANAVNPYAEVLSCGVGSGATAP
jgi:hypothetical protein